MTTPLDALQVIDLTTGIAGPYCTKLFADAGADVVKVEPIDGDPLRTHAAGATVPPGEDGALFRYLNRGKRSILAGDDERLGDLLAGADLLVEDTGTLDVEATRRRHPHLVVLSITPYGRTGPLAGAPATDLTIQGDSGAILFRGPPGRPPVQAGGRISELMAGSFAAPPALAAVLRARGGGPGEHIDVSHHDVMAVAGSNYMDLLHDLQGRPPAETPLRILDTPGIEQASDGLVGFNTNTGHMFQMFLLLIEQPELMDDPAYASLSSRIAMGDEWQKLIDAWVGERTVAEVVDAAVALRIPVAPLHDGSSLATDEQLTARGALTRADDGLLQPLPPYRIDGERPPVRLAAPTLGQHHAAVTPRVRRPAPAAEVTLPLAGLTVIDLTSWWVGALATQTLAVLGADVIHVESTHHPDGMRLTGHRTARSEEWWEWGHMFTAANAGKRGITLDLGTDEGLGLLRRLVAGADVLVENFSPRVAERWGLDHAGALALNPDIVYLRMPAFGLDGPWRDRPAFAQIIEPMSTMASVTGFPDGLPVSKGGLPDPVTAMHGAWAALLGIAEQRRRRSGVAIESVMLEATVNVAAQTLLEHDAYGAALGRTGNRSPHAAPQGVYPCVDGRWLALSVTDDDQWRALADALGWEHDEACATHEDRAARHDELDDRLAAWSVGQDVDAAAAALLGAGVPAAPCRDPRGISAHPHFAARHLFEVLDHPVVGRHVVPGAAYTFASVDRWLDRPAPTLGQHTGEVLRERLGLTEEEVDDLAHRGITGTRPADV